MHVVSGGGVHVHLCMDMAHPIKGLCRGWREAEGGASVVSQHTTSHLCRVGGEAVVVADVAPEAPRKDLQAAILVAGACAAVNEAGRVVKLCNMQDTLLRTSVDKLTPLLVGVT